ncbi:MAG: hypothetical protein BGP06_04440 [Rhizobiales bacterium 65-9]|nr:DUF2336 domain-containing protein [Hyphomicrobiales bacterium]OJY32451.1 MAG: hypothetical protein BGP06_04440 [Rhizobiales bacterium 65-9]
MIVRRFLEWSQTAQAGGRAEAASALARAYLYSDIEPDQRREAIAALTVMLDDPAPIVRRSLAEAFASAADAPPHIVVALTLDQSEIAALVLARSPVLCDADLIDAVAVGDAAAHIAIAGRAGLSAGVCGALAEIAGPAAHLAVLRNRSVQPPAFAYRRMIERNGDHAELREAMLAREDLPASVRHMLVVAVSKALSDFVSDCAWIRPERGERMVAEARDNAVVTIAGEEADCAAFVSHLCRSRQLNAGLLLRALLCGQIGLLEAALAELADVPRPRVSAILAERRSAGFAALYRRAGLPDGLFRAFDAGLSAWRTSARRIAQDDRPAALSRPIIAGALAAIDDSRPENAKLIALLRRFEAEAAREEARALVAGFMVQPVDELELEIRRLIDDQSALAA